MAIATIGMISSYSGLSQRSDWLWQQTPEHFGIWDNIQIHTTAPKPDFLLMYQFDFPKSVPKSPLKSPLKKFLLNRFRKQQPKSKPNIHQVLDNLNVPQERIIYLLR